MNAQTHALRAAPLVWGEGPALFEIFLEPTCPFSCKALGKLDDFLVAAGPNRVAVRIWLQSQPWHLFSGVVTRAILAASTGPGGKDDALAVMRAVAAHRDAYEFERHAGGPNMDVTPRQLLARLEGHSGVALADAFAEPTLDRVMKLHARYARQNGIHVSPTFMVDGLVQADMSSGDEVSAWVAKLPPV